MIDLTALKKELVGLAEGSLEDITDPQFMRLLSRAIDNRYQEVFEMCDTEYNLEVTLTATVNAHTIAVPSDMYLRDDRNVWHLYTDDSFTDMMAGKDLFHSLKGSNLRFDSKLEIGEEIFLQYSRKPKRYTAMSEDFIEEGAMEVLLSEVQALFYAAIDENEPNASYANSLNQANRNSL